MTIQHRMNRAFGGKLDRRESPRQALSDLARTPAGIIMLGVENVVLHLKRESIRIPIRTPAPVGQPLNSAFLVAIEILYPVLREIPNSLQSSAIDSPANRRATN